MLHTLADQLSALPLLTTVLRVDFDLYEASGSFEEAASILRDWANQKCLPFGVGISPDALELSHSAERFRLEFGRTADAWSLFLEHPDSREQFRSWICEIALELKDSKTRFSTRLSHRQPMNLPLPLPRAPKYVSEIVKRIGAVDQRVLEGAPQRIGAAEVSALTNLLESKSRRLPVIAISDDDLSEGPACFPGKVADFHCGIAHVVHLDVGGSWALTNLWGTEWSTYRGAVRCYLPGLNHKSGEPLNHRLWLAQTVRRLDANRADGFLNLCLRQVFATVTAEFEPFPLLSPAAVRRRLAESTATQEAATVSEAAEKEEIAGQVLSEPVRTGTVPLGGLRDALSRAAAEALERAALIEKDYRERIDILTEQLKNAEDQLQQARNQGAQDRVRLEKLQEELDLYGQVNSELQLKINVLTGKVSDEGSEVVKTMWASFSGFFQSIQNLSTQYKRVESEVVDRQQIEEELDEAKADIYSLRAQVEVLNLRKQGVPLARAELRLNDSDSLESFMNDQAYGTIKILQSAAKAYRDYPFKDLERMIVGLTILRDHYLPMKLAARDESAKLHEEFQQCIKSGNFTFGWTAKEANRKHNEDDHTVKLPDGRRISCEKIRDKTTNMNWQFFFGVYFAWDEVERILYLKGFGHGESPSART